MITPVRLSLDSEQDLFEWERLADGLGAGPYLRPFWTLAVSRAYGHEPLVLGVRGKEGGLEGVLPLIHIRPPFTRGALVSLPFCDYGGPLAGTSEVERVLLAEALAAAEELKARLEIRAARPLKARPPVLTPFGGKVRLLLPLPEEAEELWTGLKSKVRSQVRRPQKAGLHAEAGGMEELSSFYRIFARRMHRLGSPVHGRALFEELFRAAGAGARLFLVRGKEGPVAGAVLLFSGRTATVPWAASLTEYNRFSPNMLLYWTMLSSAVESGMKLFDFGRSSPGSGTYRFKLQWGAKPEPLYWYRWAGHERPASPEAVPGEGGPGLRALAERLWARLPLWTANTLGPHIRKYIPL